jgi:hypothetical protein
MPVDNWRAELARHQEDDFAHGHALSVFEAGELGPYRQELRQWQSDVGARLTTLERMQQRTIGGLMVISTLVGGGVLGIFGHRLGLF